MPQLAETLDNRIQALPAERRHAVETLLQLLAKNDGESVTADQLEKEVRAKIMTNPKYRDDIDPAVRSRENPDGKTSVQFAVDFLEGGQAIARSAVQVETHSVGIVKQSVYTLTEEGAAMMKRLRAKSTSSSSRGDISR
jgi:hypothetical protein